MGETPSPLTWKNITCIPCFHNRIQFARQVRKAFNSVQPDVVALELPDIYYSDLIQGIERLPRLSLVCLQQADQQLTYLPVFPSDAMIEGLRLAREYKIPAALIDLAVENYNLQQEAFAAPDDEAIEIVGLEAFYRQVSPHLKPAPGNATKDQNRESHMAARLAELSQKYERVLLVCGMGHWEAIYAHLEAGSGAIQSHHTASVDAPFLAKVGPRAREALLDEIPYLVFQYELGRRFNLTYQRERLNRQLAQEARQAESVQEMDFSPREVRNFLQYAYKLAVTDKRVSPDLYNLILAAKQTLGDDYALEVLALARNYPYVDDEDLPEIEFDPHDERFALDGRRIELRRHLSTPLPQLQREWRELITPKKRDELPEGYQPLWFYFGFFSHIPEDIVLEAFIDRLGEKLADDPQFQREYTHEFKGSLMDGLDMRETLRNRHLNKLYVKETRREPLAIGTWILIFDEDLSQEKYPWVLSLSAEHHNESDIAFYASNPLLHPVSHDIVKAQYGALMAFKPALPADDKLEIEALDVDGDLRKEHLIRQAIYHSPRPDILYFARQKPEAYLFELAKKQQKNLYHLSLERVSQRLLKRIQTFHLLSRKEVRNDAEDYI